MSFVTTEEVQQAQSFVRVEDPDDPDEVQRGIDFLKKKGAEDESSPLHGPLQELIEISKKLIGKDEDLEK